MMYKVKAKLKGNLGRSIEIELYSPGARPTEKKCKELISEKLNIPEKDVYTVNGIERL